MSFTVKLGKATASVWFILNCWPIAQKLNKHTFVCSFHIVSCGKPKVNASCIPQAFGLTVEKYGWKSYIWCANKRSRSLVML